LLDVIQVKKIYACVRRMFKYSDLCTYVNLSLYNNPLVIKFFQLYSVFFDLSSRKLSIKY